MTKRTFLILTAALLTAMVSLLLSGITKSYYLMSFLAPFGAILAAGILIISGIKQTRAKLIRLSFLIYAVAALLWGISDILRYIIVFSGYELRSFTFLYFTYSLVGTCIISALAVYVITQFSKWNIIQLVIDVITSIVITLIFIWIVYLNKNYTPVRDLLQAGYFVSGITDLLICITVFTCYLSVRDGTPPAFIRIMSYGASLYALVNLTFFYTFLHGMYTISAYMTALHIVALNIIAFGALWRTYTSTDKFNPTSLNNEGTRIRFAHLFILPAITILIKTTGLIDINLTIKDVLTFIILIAVYRFLSRYVQLSVEYNKLLKREQNTNKRLEQQVADQIKELTFLANQDTLTTLFNRRHFIGCLQESIGSKRNDEKLAVLLIDIDRFKTINDHFGHDVGDSILLNLSNRLIAWNKHGATIARLGGDEFAIMLLGEQTAKDVEAICSQIIALFGTPILCSDNALSVTISIGIAFQSDEANDVNTIMKHADIAMYRAKSQGYNKYETYNPVLYKDITNKTKIEILLRQADISNDFELFYQPQFSLPDKTLIGAEALLRWKTDEYSYIPPSLFIPVAEETNFIHKIGKWVMLKALKQAKIWNSRLPVPLKIGINISPKQLNDDELINSLKMLIKGSHINPGWLDVEITENIMLGVDEDINPLFQLLKSSGISISIDDFGSGYSSLAYLNKYRFDRIKLDKSLIDNLSTFNENGNNIVKAAISMAKSAGVLTIAEGVEKQEQLEILTQLGCDQVQGYLLGRPVPADIFEQLFLNL